DVIAAAGSLEQRIALLPHLIAVAEAIAYAHHRRVIHRDLKPHNVIIGEFGETMVIDWGIAKRLDDDAPDGAAPAAGDSPADTELTHVGDVLGTPAFMSPEQADGGPVDERADVYALGGMLHVLCAGRHAFADARFDKITGKLVRQPAPPLAEL